jgi:PTS system nitrogen regulatory IIA component
VKNFVRNFNNFYFFTLNNTLNNYFTLNNFVLGIQIILRVWGLNLMIVSDILSPDAILTSIKASSKKRVLQEISIAVQNLYGLNQSEVFLALQKREDLGPTGMGHGVAIPHARISSLKSIKGLFAKLIKPLDFGSMDSQNVDLLFVLIAPHESGANHLKALAKISRILRNKSTCEKLRSTVDKSALYSILTTETEIQAA